MRLFILGAFFLMVAAFNSREDNFKCSAFSGKTGQVDVALMSFNNLFHDVKANPKPLM